MHSTQGIANSRDGHAHEHAITVPRDDRPMAYPLTCHLGRRGLGFETPIVLERYGNAGAHRLCWRTAATDHRSRVSYSTPQDRSGSVALYVPQCRAERCTTEVESPPDK